ncbi:MAG TPA: pitrilysin family protein, partial [Kofleriaceae bacterium]|nr:pitrilysin family protein [Kofleriaceae bacterium]
MRADLRTTEPSPLNASSPLCHVRRVNGIDEYRIATNGLRVLFMPWRAAPVAVLMLTYEVGSRHEPLGRKGMSHLLEHMMFRGSAAFDRRGRRSILDLLPAIGARANATTWLDRTNYFNLVPVTELELAAAIEADRMRGLQLDADDLEAERSIVLDEYDLRDGDPHERWAQAVWSAAFDGHPYGSPAIGVRDDILAISRDDLREHHRRYCHPGNATLTVVGDLDSVRLQAVVAAHFAGIPARGESSTEVPAPPARTAACRFDIELANATPSVSLAYPIPHGRHGDTDALELLALALTGGVQSRLQRELVVPGLATAVSARVSRLRGPGLFEVHAAFDDASAGDRVERALAEGIARIRVQGVDSDELPRLKGLARGALLTSCDGPVAIAMQLNEAIAAGDWTLHATACERLAAV